MDDYEELVAKAFQLQSPLPFSNDSAGHARVIMKHIFENATGRVCLYSDMLPKVSGDVEVYDWSELLDSAQQFLARKDTKLEIKVAQNEGEFASSAFVNLINKYSPKASVVWGVGAKGPNFMVSDSGSFRLEYTGAKAIACASGESVAKKLLVVFDTKIN